MSFGYSIGDFIALTQLAYNVVQGARKACGAYDELTLDVTNLYGVLQRLGAERSKSDSLLNQSDDNRKDELADLTSGCRKVLKVMDQILEKYNGLSDEERSFRKLGQKILFGNREMRDLGEIRLRVSTYTSAITLFINLLSIGSQGKVERYMDSHGDEMREMRMSLNWITAHLQAKTREGSVLTLYAEDDRVVWKDFRRELIKEGFSSAKLKQHRTVITDYIMELGNRGALDDIEPDRQALGFNEEAQAELGLALTPVLSVTPALKEVTGSEGVANTQAADVEANEESRKVMSDDMANNPDLQSNNGDGSIIKNEQEVEQTGTVHVEQVQDIRKELTVQDQVDEGKTSLPSSAPNSKVLNDAATENVSEGPTQVITSAPEVNFSKVPPFLEARTIEGLLKIKPGSNVSREGWSESLGGEIRLEIPAFETPFTVGNDFSNDSDTTTGNRNFRHRPSRTPAEQAAHNARKEARQAARRAAKSKDSLTSQPESGTNSSAVLRKRSPRRQEGNLKLKDWLGFSGESQTKALSLAQLQKREINTIKMEKGPTPEDPLSFLNEEQPKIVEGDVPSHPLDRGARVDVIEAHKERHRAEQEREAKKARKAVAKQMQIARAQVAEEARRMRE